MFVYDKLEDLTGGRLSALANIPGNETPEHRAFILSKVGTTDRRIAWLRGIRITNKS